MGHIVILGDSVFDNASYVERGEAVLDKLRSVLAPGWQVTLLARDGGVLADVSRQIERLPADATHLFVSAGGNDALRHVGVLGEPVASVHEALATLATIKEQFQERYLEMLDRVDCSNCRRRYARSTMRGFQMRSCGRSPTLHLLS